MLEILLLSIFLLGLVGFFIAWGGFAKKNNVVGLSGLALFSASMFVPIIVIVITQ